MVLPLIAAAIGGGSTLLSGLLGYSAQNKADEMNYNIALLNYYQRENERNQAMQEAARQERESKLGTTDAMGNRYYFVPGEGWRTELSPEQQTLRDAYQREEMQQLGQDLPAKRRQMFENLARQQTEGNYADSIFNAMQRLQPTSTADIVNERNLATTAGYGDAFKNIIPSAAVEAMRSGNLRGASDLVGQLGIQQGDALRKAFMQNYTGASGEATDRYMTQLGNLGNIYNTFATRASAMPGAEYNPRNIEGLTSGELSGTRSAAADKSGSLLNAMGRSGGALDFKQSANTAFADSLARMGTLFNQYDTLGTFNSQPKQDVYPKAPTDMYKEGTGLW